MKKPSVVSTLIEQRPHYYRGQLLLEDDFLAEQNYHVNARLRHNMRLHGWGIVNGLEVLRESANSVKICPGFAVDTAGHDIIITENQYLTISGFGPNEMVTIGLVYQESDDFSEKDDDQDKKRKSCYASIKVTGVSEKNEALTLALIQLDHKGEIGENAINHDTRKELLPKIRTGWVRMPFRPHPLVNLPEGLAEMPPMFRVGATEALSPDPKEAGEKDRGAAGTMAIPIPPNVTRVTRLRIAGSQNSGEIVIELLKGGWDIVNKKHVRERILDEKISSESDKNWFEKTFQIENNSLDPEYNTLCLWLQGTRRTSISLVAVEFAY